ncbi:MAG: carboxymuconolactone decarboxylase family protein [Candidatus Aminicenantes bacterium]|nr:carboxymuconolactone decarboxylase family protein [Candidatus Aminicenantes bacterium]
MNDPVQEFQAFREKMNQKILSKGDLETKRFFALDKNAYKEGALCKKTKELIGLTASLVLRCDDCIKYHLITSVDLGISDKELFEAFQIALVVGGSIVIPYVRRAVDFLEKLRA